MNEADGIENKGYSAETEGFHHKVNFKQNSFENNHHDIAGEEDHLTEPQQTKLQTYLANHKRQLNVFGLIVLNVVIGAYFAWATYYFIVNENYNNLPDDVSNGDDDLSQQCSSQCGWQWCDGYGMLLILLVFVYFWLFYFLIFKRYWGRKVSKAIGLKAFTNRISSIFANRIPKIVASVAVLLAFVAFIVVDTLDSQDRLRSLIGIVVLLGLGYIFSAHRTNVKIRPVLCGLVLQFLLGVFCIRWQVGRSIFRCFGDKVATFLQYTNVGNEFVFGNLIVNVEGVFAFTVLPVIFFFSFIISLLYYWGAMQWVIKKMGWMLQSLLGTTVCESVNSASNIFLGMSESPLLIRPYIKYLTHSEMHAIMTSGFATVSGSVLAAYISYGAEPAHLITSSVMAAPAALCFSKLFYPETEKSKTTSDNLTIEKSNDSSALDAASNGAITGIALVWGIIANLIAFVSFIAFVNGAVSWFGALVGFEELTFEWLFAKLFIPLAWIIGIPWEDCENVARLIATKTIINEFVAYERLGKMKFDKLISLRSSAIATYAICGFANPSSLGIFIGSLSAMCPEKRPTITSVAIRAFVAGSVVCFITASIAGLLMTEEIFNETRFSHLLSNETQY